MGPRKPEVEFISLPSRDKLLDNSPKEAYGSLAQLANNALKSGPFSITFDKRPPHIACTGDVRDFLSYAPFWWPEDPSNEDSKYIRKDGERNPDIGTVKDQQQLESFAESIMYLCLGYYFFKEDKYAKHAISLLEIFFINEKTRMNPNLTYAQFIRGPQNTTKTGRGEGIVSARVLCRVVNVLPVLYLFPDYHAISQHIIHWFSCYSQWLIESPVADQASKAKNNIYTWYMVHVVSVQHFLYPSSLQLTNYIKKFFEKSLPEQIDKKTGNQPLESKRTKPFHYLAFNMHAILFIAELARSIGIDVYHLKRDYLHLAAIYFTKFEQAKPGIDITEAARCVDIISKRICIDGCCSRFVEYCKHSKYAEKISGPKNIICSLWL